jgi:membrane protease YdiL (CAAX protease family)
MLRPIAASYPVLFVLGLTLACFVFVLFLMGIVYEQVRESYRDAAASTIRLAVTAGLLWLLWRLGGLKEAGVTRLGRWQVWLLAAGGMLYFAAAGLYAFYGKVAFDVSSFARLPAARTVVLTNLVSVLHEEILFRGLVLYVLFRAWGHTGLGRISSVALTAVLFAVPHITSVFMGLSLSSALLLVVEGCIIAVWWGALVVWGGSIWPAVLLHLVVNVVVAVQGLESPMVEPHVLAYRRILWFSTVLGGLGVGLLV